MEEMAQDQYVEFVVGEVKYAITIHHIHEIIRIQEITQIPNHKPFVKGVINLRGKVLPVVDLREKMGLECAAVTKLTRILVVDISDDVYGVIVDQVNRVATLTDIVPPPEYAVQAGQELMAGIAQEKDKLINILDARRIFTD
ncbi:chemotaxis protein CheW [Paenibacillus chartarius]|uniref:Chemotaxis protein CheW n=1 Tax=Paenibacillus chartarius TaxID=747481 RepID=A0ABV6DPN3_9BACL